MSNENKIYQEQRIIRSFSVKNSDYFGKAVIFKLDKYCEVYSANRSQIIIKALHEYLEKRWNNELENSK